MGASASATVSGVTISGTSATLTYDVSIGSLGTGAQKGVSVYQDGIWKVGDASFCYLMTLENGGTAQGACKALG
jgi:hypothetical protein